MTNKLHRKIRETIRVPVFLKGKNREQQVEVSRHFVSAALARSPNLRRNILHQLRLPIQERPTMAAGVASHCVPKPAIKARKIHADDRVRLAFDGHFSQLGKNAPEASIIPQYLNQPDD